jgi:hypothetical protein
MGPQHVIQLFVVTQAGYVNHAAEEEAHSEEIYGVGSKEKAKELHKPKGKQKAIGSTMPPMKVCCTACACSPTFFPNLVHQPSTLTLNPNLVHLPYIRIHQQGSYCGSMGKHQPSTPT